jgi:drug/metabolite transporter (DMT)-like permease
MTKPPRSAIILILQAAACFAVMTVIARQLSRQLDALFLVWIRGLLGAAVLAPYMLWRKIPLLGKHRLLLSTRAVVGSLGVSLMFLTAKWMPAADGLSLIMSSALFVPFVARVLLKEALNTRILGYTALGFVGVLLVIQPGFSHFSRGIAYGLATAFVHSLVYVTLRGLSSREHALTVVLYFLAGSALFTTPFLSFPSSIPDHRTLLLIALLAFCGFVGQIVMTRAYALASAATLTPFFYSQVIFATLLAWHLLAEVPTLVAIVGMLLICAAGIAISRGSSAKLPGK